MNPTRPTVAAGQRPQSIDPLTEPLSRRRFSALGLGTAAAAALGGIGLASAAPAAAEDVIKASAWSHLGGINALGQAIWRAIEQLSQANREGAVQSLLNAAWYEAGESKNVMVIKDDHPYAVSGLQGLQLEATYSFENMPTFRVFVMDSGSITNNGDGGYINWAFQGWFERIDQTVNFYLP